MIERSLENPIHSATLPVFRERTFLALVRGEERGEMVESQVSRDSFFSVIRINGRTARIKKKVFAAALVLLLKERRADVVVCGLPLRYILLGVVLSAYLFALTPRPPSAADK